GAVNTGINAINGTGDIVGGYQREDQLQHGFVLSQGNFTFIDVPGAVNTLASGNNDTGDIVGTFETTDYRWHGVLLSQGNLTPFDVTGISGVIGTQPRMISAAGTIVGSVQIQGQPRDHWSGFFTGAAGWPPDNGQIPPALVATWDWHTFLPT